MAMAVPGTNGVLGQGAEEQKGETARLASFVGAMAIADLVKTTLGPKGMDKILQSMGRTNDIMVTNDGATILKSLYVDNPAAKVLVDISRVQDDEVGDGTTSVVVLAGELLREAEQLVLQKIHPMTIIAGYRQACEAAKERLELLALNHSSNEDTFRQDLLNIAKTTLSSKILTQDKEHFARLAVDAVLRLKGSSNLESIHIIKKTGGTLKESFLDEGFILDKRIGVGQPKRIENAKILVANTAMDTDKIKIYGARVRVDSMAKVADIEKAEKEKMRAKVENIISQGLNCFVNRQLIYNFPEEIFADAGVMAIEHADFDGIERLALVTGSHVLDEAERSLHDALCVLQQTVQDSRVIYGGGYPEMQMAKVVEEKAARTPGKKSLAIEAYARALRAIPGTICDNAGLDSAELISQLRAAHAEDDTRMGVDVVLGKAGDMADLGIYECFRVKEQIILSATEASEMILRVDDIIKCAPRQRQEE
ncbi:MAG: T-complex 1 subunit beta-like [Trebouxia sp. A1-2]|nr:MAG: T-complex 1 subunit beta-like [Trebouxia sp. A1-2]